VLAINSAIGLFYYLRIIAAFFEQAEGQTDQHIVPASRIGNAVLACLLILLIWLGVYPGPMMK
jgi:NADH-quinone oxidoreductase subunit N